MGDRPHLIEVLFPGEVRADLPLGHQEDVLVRSMARSRARMEICRSTSNVRDMWGNTVRPRRARTADSKWSVPCACSFLRGW